MPFETVPRTNLSYHLIAYDADGHERDDDPDGKISEIARAALISQPVTDVFLISHGWKGDVPAAREQYNNWIAAMAACTDDVARVKHARPGFTPLIIGFHWPSQPWGDEEVGTGAASFAAVAGDDATVGLDVSPGPAGLVDAYAARLADTPRARAALETIFAAAAREIAPQTLPDDVRRAYEILNEEAALGSGGEGAEPGADREPFDPDASYAHGRSMDPAASFGSSGWGGILSPLRQLSFWKMKDRARRIGESAGFDLLTSLQRAVPAGRSVRFHLMGHSFGCIVVSAMLNGPNGRGVLPRPVDSVTLVQGAFSLWSFCNDIPKAPGRPGYFRTIMDTGKVAGPIVTTQSVFDTAVGRFYPIGAGVARQVVFAPGEWPKYGGVGTFGIQGPGLDVVPVDMLPVSEAYHFESRKIYNLEGSSFIRGGSGASGAHNDIAKPEVAHAMWEAACLLE